MYNVKNIAAHRAMRHSAAVIKVSTVQAMFNKSVFMDAELQAKA